MHDGSRVGITFVVSSSFETSIRRFVVTGRRNPLLEAFQSNLPFVLLDDGTKPSVFLCGFELFIDLIGWHSRSAKLAEEISFRDGADHAQGSGEGNGAHFFFLLFQSRHFWFSACFPSN